MSHLENQSRTLQRQLNVALAKLELDAPAKAVHRLRTTVRRIQTLINSGDLQLRGKERQALRDLEKMRKRAGKVRDLDVQLGLLRALGNRSAEQDRRALGQALLDKRVKKAKRLEAAARGIVESKFASHLRDALRHGSPASDQEKNPLTQAEGELQQLATGFQAHPQLSRKQLHRMRIRLKMIRYLAEVSPDSDAREKFVDQLKSVQTILGEWRDWELLEKTAEKLFAERTNCALLAEIRALLGSKRARVHPAIAGLLAPRTDILPKKQPQSAQAHRAVAQHA
jgi:CHAD domain-containing protein